MKQRTPCRTKGIALVIVLAFLVLISGIVIAFFSSVSTELVSAKATSDSAATHQLADSAVNVVMAQIVDGTKSQETSNGTLAWASQPGMIRTFDASGKAKSFFKLYSSDQMVVDGNSFSLKDDLPPADWSKADNASLFTDLNEPVLIADPAGLIQRPKQGGPKFTAIYPIIDPFAEGMVDGFSLTSRPGFASDKLPATDTDPTLHLTDKTGNPAPMPVKWIYVLKNGMLQSAFNPKDGAVTVAGATKENPIVGRIAFWADDETAKVNINTASEGTYWDVPRVFSMEDYGMPNGKPTSGMAVCQPAQKEFQRYPGHPATTCLSSVFKTLLPVPYPYPRNPADIEAAQLDPYYKIAPRIGLSMADGGLGGGSRGGSITPPPVLTTDSDRLYASIDELMFTPNLTTTSPLSRVPNTAPANTKEPKVITKGVLEKAKFFITANSTAPETTLYNTPRVAVWPANSAANQRTAHDKLMAFCSTVGSNAGSSEYYFTRSDSRNLSTDYTSSPRNKTLYAYLQKLTSLDVPGFGGSFLKKYGAGASGITDRDQILTSIYDYIRCVNLSDTTTGAVPFAPKLDQGDIRSGFTPGAGEAVPIRIPLNNTQGYGRFYTVSEADILFYGSHATSGKTDKIKAVFLLEFSSPMQGMGGLASNLKYEVKGLNNLQVQMPGDSGYRTMGFPADGINWMKDNCDMSTFHGRSVGGTEGPTMAMTVGPWNNGTQKKLTIAGAMNYDANVPNYPFFTPQDISFSPSSSTNFKFQSVDEVIVEIRAFEMANSAPPIQTIHLKFPPGEFKIPDVFKTGDFDKDRGLRSTNTFVLVQTQDTVIGLEPAGIKGSGPAPGLDATAGDIRMIAALPDVPATMFRAHNDYKTVGVQFAYGLNTACGKLFAKATAGKLVPVTSYPQYSPSGPATERDVRIADVPSRVGNQVTRSDGKPGDWDTGVGDQKDGAYINKPDEVDSNTSNGRMPYLLGNINEFQPSYDLYFSPNRQMPSALMFGSIPTGVQQNHPWQTLLFHPRPEETTAPFHPGFGTPKVPAPGSPFILPPDYLIADLFWMPVIEPYAISQPFSTAGKINMNYQIVPFTYIQRQTGLYAVMKATKFMALPLSDNATAKQLDPNTDNVGIRNPDRRRSIDMGKTLADFETKFKSNQIFKSATQICEMNFVPPEVGASSGMGAFWNNNQLTGDNVREKPYVDIYPRLTTKSNTFTVHVRVQALKKAPGTPADQWVGSKDQVLGEYRGWSILERYIDLNDTLPDFATKFVSNPQDSTLNIDQYYKMRILSTKRFAP